MRPSAFGVLIVALLGAGCAVKYYYGPVGLAPAGAPSIQAGDKWAADEARRLEETCWRVFTSADGLTEIRCTGFNPWGFAFSRACLDPRWPLPIHSGSTIVLACAVEKQHALEQPANTRGKAGR